MGAGEVALLARKQALSREGGLDQRVVVLLFSWFPVGATHAALPFVRRAAIVPSSIGGANAILGADRTQRIAAHIRPAQVLVAAEPDPPARDWYQYLLAHFGHAGHAQLAGPGT